MASLFKPRTVALAKMAKLPQYQHPALLGQQLKKPMEIQRLQIEGQLPFDKGQYHSPAYQTLIKSLKQSRTSYRNATSFDAKLQVSTKEFTLWEEYVQQGINRLPQNKKIDQIKRNRLFQAYTGSKQRTQDKIACKKLLNFHDEYAKGYTFDIEIHPRILLQMVHPHFGYLLNYDRKLTLDELIDFFHRMIFASEQRYLGQTLHSDEISAYNYWRLFSIEPSLKLSKFCQLIKAFKIDTTPETFTKDFQYSLRNSKGQLLQNAKTDQTIRFDLFRKIFLERGL